jgi:nucleoside-diphosphate-sugar epimerase
MVNNIMNVVSGSSGFIGSHLKLSLPGSVGLDKRESPYTEVVDDLSSPYFAWGGEQVGTLYHLAASPLSIVRGDWLAESGAMFRDNVAGTYNALRGLKPGRIVFSSTANLYGEGRRLGEDSPIRISSGYGWSKWVGEEMIRKSGIPYTIYRFGTVVGARGRTFPNRLVWCAVNGVPVELFCGGDTWRDLVDVRDIVSALLLDAPCDTFNVATGIEVSGRGLAGLIAEEAANRGFKLNYTIGDKHPRGYVRESTLSIDNICDTLGWKPRYDIYRTVESLFDYYESHGAREPPGME